VLSSLLASAVLVSSLGSSPQELWQAWPEERFVATAAPCLRHGPLAEGLRRLKAVHGDSLRLDEVGRSFEDRPIFLVTVGRGEKKVLLWSQMHGDEPSATPALLDLADYLLRHAQEPAAKAILDELTLLLVPMLNPDGTEIYERRNAQGIDINRDALSLSTPEGRLLKKLRDEHEPLLGFNLHDQDRRTAVGDSGVLATNALLAVAGDEQGTLTPGRERAKRACAAIVTALSPFVPGRIARYDEDWSPRAFGDNLTAWGTPVVLIESGAVPPGMSFEDLTRLNFVALLSVLQDLVENDLADHDPRLYEELLRNESDAWADVVVRGGSVLQPGTAKPYRADLAFDVLRSELAEAGCEPEKATASRIVELGDARFLGASRTVEAEGGWIVSPFIAGIEGWKARRWLDGKALDRLARLGVGEVRWAVRPRQRKKARVLAAALQGPGRPKIAFTTHGSGTKGPELTLRRAPTEPNETTGPTLEALVEALTGQPEANFRGDRSVLQVLGALSRSDGEARRGLPALRRGGAATFLILEAGADAEPAHPRLKAVWLDGREVELEP
jgi:hypothetical protein